MGFKDQILQLAGRIEKLPAQLKNGRSYKSAPTLHFIQVLGYDVFNPFEVSPEFIVDMGIKKREKVDYAIMKDDLHKHTVKFRVTMRIIKWALKFCAFKY